MLRSPLRPALSPALRHPLEPGVGSIWSAAYSFASGVLPAAIAALTRGGLATRVGPTGNVEFGPHNLVPQSDFASGWTAEGVTVTAATGPTAGSSAVELTTTGSGEHRLYIGGVLTVGSRVSHSVAAKFVSCRYLGLSAGFGAYYAIFDMQTATVHSSVQCTALTPVAGGDGYGEYALELTTGAPSSFCVVHISETAAGAVPNVGSTSSGQIARVCRHSANLGRKGIYVPTTTAARFLPIIEHSPVSPFAALGLRAEGPATQLLPNWNQFNLWNRSQTGAGVLPVVTTGQSDSPLAFDTSCRVDFNAPASGDQSFLNSASIAVVNTSTYTGGIRIKAATAGDIGKVLLFRHVGGGVYGLITLTSSWQRVSRTEVAGATSAEMQIGLRPAIAGSSAGTVSVLLSAAQLELGSVLTSDIPNPGTGSLVRVGDFAGGGLTGAALTDLITPTSPFTIRFAYRKAYSQAGVETLFGLCAGATAGGTNQLQLVTAGIQARLIHSGGSGSLTGTLIHNGTANDVIAVSVDPVGARMSISVNGGAAVETTGIAYTGSGVTAMVLGARNSAGTDPAVRFTFEPIQANRRYITGAALQALSV